MKKIGMILFSLVLLGLPTWGVAQSDQRQAYPAWQMVDVTSDRGTKLSVGVVEVIRGDEAWNRVKENEENQPPGKEMEYAIVRVKSVYRGGPPEFVNFRRAWAETPDGIMLEKGVPSGGIPWWFYELKPEKPELETEFVFLAPKGVTPLYFRLGFGAFQTWEVWFLVP